MFYNNGDGTHSITGLQLSDGEAKFRTDKDWDNNDYGGTFPAENELLINDFDGNISVTAGTYDVTVDLNNNTFIFELVGNANDQQMFKSFTIQLIRLHKLLIFI